MTESSIVRQNLMDNKNYRPYCMNQGARGKGDGCYNPRMEYRSVDGQFICPHCKTITEFPEDFIKRYKEKHQS